MNRGKSTETKNTPNPVNPSWSWTKTATKLNQQSPKNRKEKNSKENLRRKGEGKKAAHIAGIGQNYKKRRAKPRPLDMNSKKYTVVNKGKQKEKPRLYKVTANNRGATQKGNWTRQKHASALPIENKTQTRPYCFPYPTKGLDTRCRVSAACSQCFSDTESPNFPTKWQNLKNGSEEKERNKEV